MNILQSIKYRFVHSLGSIGSSDGEKLVHQYELFPRHTPTQIRFRNFTFSTPDALSVAFQIKDVLAEEKLRFKTTNNPITIFDCGANVGVVSVYCKRLFPTANIVAFEADSNVARYLKENLAQNHIDEATVIEKAVWIHNDGVSFGSEGADSGSIHFPENRSTVPSVRLREYLAREEKIALLKIDIEGAELDVIRDCADELKKVDNLFVEYHEWKSQPQKLEELLHILGTAGFRYHIESESVLAHPFTDTPKGNMALQLNIYASR